MDPTTSSYEQRRMPWIPIILVLLLGLGLLYVFGMKHRGAGTAIPVIATEGRITLEKDDGKSLASIDRNATPEVWFRVTLDNAPVGQALTLDCHWIDPAGHVAHQNHYTTKEIDKTVWPTHARFQLGPTSPLGKWTVKLVQDGRLLQAASFEVTGAPAAVEKN